jgi:hypothetical protein
MLNKVRSAPQKYAELYIQPTLRFFEGNLYKRPGEVITQTQRHRKSILNSTKRDKGKKA